VIFGIIVGGKRGLGAGLLPELNLTRPRYGPGLGPAEGNAFAENRQLAYSLMRIPPNRD